MIYITFKTSDSVISLDASQVNVDDLPNEPYWNDVVYINCQYALWSTLPLPLPKKLQVLICDYNRLTDLGILPETIRSIKASNNRIRQLPNFSKMVELESIDLSVNYLDDLLDLNLPWNLKTLDFTSNMIEKISVAQWPEHLVELKLDYNRISDLDMSIDNVNISCNVSLSNNEFPWQKYNAFCLWIKDDMSNLQEVQDKVTRYARYGMKVPVKHPTSIQTHFPMQIPRPMGGQHFTAFNGFGGINMPDGVEDEQWINMQLDNIFNLDRKPELKSVYQDAHNVHASSVQNTTNVSLKWLIDKGPPNINAPNLIKKTWSGGKVKRPFRWWSLFAWLRLIFEEPLPPACELLDRFCSDSIVHSVHGITYGQLIGHMWNVISTHKDKEEILNILKEDILASSTICFTGRFTKTLNVLSGFVEEIQVGISDKEQMQNRIVQKLAELRKNFESESEEYNKKATEDIATILTEFKIPAEEQSAWLDAI